MSTPPPVSEAIAAVRARVAAAAEAAGRAPDDVRILFASKTVSAERAAEAVLAGADLLGESRVQEVVAKAEVLGALPQPPRIHLIGHLQSNKVNAALRHVDCIETIDALPLAERISDRCVAVGRELDVLVQVNVSGEPSKFGAPPDDAVELALRVAALPGVRLRGLMTIGANSPDASRVRAGYALLRELRDTIVGSSAPGTEDATELSMGMSGDLELAIAEGATTVRVGSAVFGARPRP